MTQGLNPAGKMQTLKVDAAGALVVTGGTGGGGGAGTSDTTEATQLLVKAAVQSLDSKTAALVQKQVIDEASATVTYLGEAPLGTALSAAAWRIKRITTAGTLTTIEFSPANSIFNNRAALGYT